MNNAKIMREDAIKEKHLRGNNAKIQLAKIMTVIMIFTAFMLSWFVFDVKPDKKWVYDNYDKTGILSDNTINYINEKNSILYNDSQKEIVVVIEKENGDNRDLTKRAEKLFKDYKVNNNGMLFIIVVPEKTASSKNFFDDIGDFLGNLFGGTRGYYAYHTGMNVVERSFKDNIAGILEKHLIGSENHTAADNGYYNAAVLNVFNDLMVEFGYHNIATAHDYSTVVPTIPPVPPIAEDYPTKYPN